jgi:hypothetical protein
LWSSCAAKSPSFSSDRSGTQYEEIYAKLAMGTWYARVRSTSGAYSATVPYKLRFRPLSDRLQVLSSTSWITSYGGLTIVGELLNNTGVRYQYPEVYALLLNASGQVVEEDSGSSVLDLPGPRQRSPFEVDVLKVPVGYAKYELVAVGETTTTAAVSGLVLTAGAPYTEYGIRTYPGSVRNSGAAVAQDVSVGCTLYDKLGGVMNVDWAFTSPYTLMAGKTGTFDCSFLDHWIGANRVGYAVEGS